jgi:hypothetical protein
MGTTMGAQAEDTAKDTLHRSPDGIAKDSRLTSW